MLLLLDVEPEEDELMLVGGEDVVIAVAALVVGDEALVVGDEARLPKR